MTVKILTGDCLEVLNGLPPCFRVNCCVTSPPYFGLRDYGHAEQIGLETTPAEYVAKLVTVFRAVRDHLRDDGTLWLNLGDSYASGGVGGASNSSTLGGGGGRYRNGSKLEAMHEAGQGKQRRVSELKPKDLLGIPWRVAFALQADGWYLRSDIIWHKPNPMPESVTDRPTKSHEYLFLLSKSAKYYYDAEAIAEPASENKPWGASNGGTKIAITRGDGDSGTLGLPANETRNKRTVWTVPTSPYSEAHFATFPPTLIEPCILAGCPRDGTVLDPFGGAGTTGLVADRNQRNAMLIELNPEYAAMAEKRIRGDSPLFAQVQT